ncbi:MAG: hypothetical protein IJ568_02530 [Bacilli bacterium]|nr:hypothetical protein [Bacilli bacterium]
MKKLFEVFLFILILVGCTKEMPNTKVEEFFSKYQQLDEEVLKELEFSMELNPLNEQQKNLYRDLMRRQYKDLEYTIKKEVINQEDATVTVEIEVYDYSIAVKEADEFFQKNQNYFINEENKVDENKYIDYKLELMKDIKDRIKYTIDLKVKRSDKSWIVENLNQMDREKIHGLFTY